MIKAGIKKELMLFTRGFKLLGVIITIVAISLLYPFTYKSMELMANQISDMGQQMGGETQGQVENAASSINNMLGSISEMYGGSMAAVGFKTGVSSLTSTGSLVIMLLLMSAAGGEQKKRSVIIPTCAGLSPSGYVAILYSPRCAVRYICSLLLRCTSSQDFPQEDPVYR